MENENGADTQESITPAEETTDNLEGKVEAPERPQWLPEKFKTEEAMGDAYENLERKFTESQQNLKERERLIDEYLLSNVNPKESQKKSVDWSSIDDSGMPGAQIGGLVEETVNSATGALSKEVSELKEMVRGISAKAEVMSLEPDYSKYATDPQFIKWAKDSYPQAVLQQVDSDPKSAAWLVGEYKQRFSTQSDSENTEIKDVDTTRGAPVTGSGKGGRGNNKKVWTRTELAELRSKDPDKYQSLSDEIDAAYKEGRVK